MFCISTSKSKRASFVPCMDYSTLSLKNGKKKTTETHNGTKTKKGSNFNIVVPTYTLNERDALGKVILKVRKSCNVDM